MIRKGERQEILLLERLLTYSVCKGTWTRCFIFFCCLPWLIFLLANVEFPHFDLRELPGPCFPIYRSYLCERCEMNLVGNHEPFKKMEEKIEFFACSRG